MTNIDKSYAVHSDTAGIELLTLVSFLKENKKSQRWAPILLRGHIIP